jgi:DNA end-binding protein Ku
MNATITIRSFEAFRLPIKTFSAIEDTSPKSHYLHSVCKTQINTVPKCPKCNKLISMDDVVEGYVVPGQEELAILTAAEQQAFKQTDKKIEILEFIPLSELDPLKIMGAAYYLGTADENSEQYRLFYRGLWNRKAIGIGFWTFRNRERLVLIRSDHRGLLVMQPIYFNDEIRRPDAVRLKNGTDLNREYLAIWNDVISAKTNNVPDWTKYHDPYVIRLNELFASRSKRGKLKGAKRNRTLLDLLTLPVGITKAKPKRERKRKSK